METNTETASKLTREERVQWQLWKSVTHLLAHYKVCRDPGTVTLQLQLQLPFSFSFSPFSLLGYVCLALLLSYVPNEYYFSSHLDHSWQVAMQVRMEEY